MCINDIDDKDDDFVNLKLGDRLMVLRKKAIKMDL